jgi:hypothetical protein
VTIWLNGQHTGTLGCDEGGADDDGTAREVRELRC